MKKVRLRTWVYVGLAVVVLVAVLTPLYVVPVDHGFSFTLTVCPSGGTSLQQFNGGSTVQLSWSEPDGSSVRLTIQQGMSVDYDVVASAGSFSFVSDGSVYQFVASSSEAGCAAQPVDVSGEWNAPVL